MKLTTSRERNRLSFQKRGTEKAGKSNLYGVESLGGQRNAWTYPAENLSKLNLSVAFEHRKRRILTGAWTLELIRVELIQHFNLSELNLSSIWTYPSWIYPAFELIRVEPIQHLNLFELNLPGLDCVSMATLSPTRLMLHQERQRCDSFECVLNCEGQSCKTVSINRIVWKERPDSRCEVGQMFVCLPAWRLISRRNLITLCAATEKQTRRPDYSQ